jgi:hypothetical protein
MVMSALSLSPNRRNFLAFSAAAGAACVLSSKLQAETEDGAIRPFRIDVPEEELVNLRQRIAATKWPERETVSDATQGVQLATMRELARYWATDYDWRKVEARLNGLPQFITEIDGLDIHFIHLRSPHENALPLIVTHGWPGSVIEQLKIIEPLTNPTAHGASASDAFHLVIPSLPGYGFSGKPTAPGWTPDRIARAWTTLMQRLGYTRYVAQGGDWGNAVSELMALQQPPDCSASTPTCQLRFQPTSQRRSRSTRRRPPVFRATSATRLTNSSTSMERGSGTLSRCRTARKRSMASRIRLSDLPRG